MPNTPIPLPQSSAALQSDTLKDTLQKELAALPLEALPLAQAMQHGSHVHGIDQVMLLEQTPAGTRMNIRVGIFFSSMLGGCHCADDPGPIELMNEYVELTLQLDPSSACATLLSDASLL